MCNTTHASAWLQTHLDVEVGKFVAVKLLNTAGNVKRNLPAPELNCSVFQLCRMLQLLIAKMSLQYHQQLLASIQLCQ